MYQLLIEKHVLKQLEKVSEPDYSRIKQTMLDLAKNPRPNGCKKLKGIRGYRVRKGNYRIIYDINDNKLVIYVLEIGHRKDIYD